MGKRIAIALLIIAAALVAIAGFWTVSYPDAYDSKNMKHVLWKHGLYHLNSASVLSGLAADPQRDQFVIGRSKEEIEAILGPLVPIRTSGHYIPSCWTNARWPEDHIFFVDKDYWWYVVFAKGRAVEFNVAKGC